MSSPFQLFGHPVVLAFGGNALLPDPFHPEDQEQRAEELARAVMMLHDRASGIVLVHGNGPQVGMILLRVEETRDRLPAEPLDMLVAETQGSIGYLLTRVLHNALRAHGSTIGVTSILSQVVVDADDPAFDRPTKPVGPFYSDETAQRLRNDWGWQLEEDTGRGWRRVVPSPRPIEVVEMGFIQKASRGGGVVIAGGGGGVPVRREGDELEGVEAVIDKDRTAALISLELEASAFIILTGVPHVSTGFGTPQAQRLATLPCAQARELIEAGEFPEGSMGPKMEAAVRYVEARGHPALITDIGSLKAAMDGEAGTWIVP